MGNADLVHFESYRAQTQLKHEVLEQYLKAYFTAIKGKCRRLVYLDAFAGPGVYRQGAAEFDGSPLRAIKLVASDSDLHASVKIILVERYEPYVRDLEIAVRAHVDAGKLALSPEVHCMTCSEFFSKWKGGTALAGYSDAAVFLFADPCGVDGVRMEDITHVLKRPFSEVFLFFNYDGVNRICGAAQETGASETLTNLLGNDKRVKELLIALRHAVCPADREQIILSSFKRSLQSETGAAYILAFRIESERREQTSHYLLYATKALLGFRIMKHVMWEAAAKSTGQGGFQMLQASASGPGLFDDAKLSYLRPMILTELQTGHRQVKIFTEAWADRPWDLFSPKAYRDCLLGLETDGQVVVYDKSNSLPAPATTRRKGTLAGDFWLRLP